MMTLDDYFHTVEQKREVIGRAYENDKAVVVYYELSGKYEAIEKAVRGQEYGKYPQYHRSTKGDFKRAKKAFERYSGM